MAKLPASQALEAYTNKKVRNLSSTIKERTAALRKRRGSISFKEEDEVKPPKPSEILKEYKAQIEMGKLREKEMERASTGMSRTEFEDYENTVKTQKALAKTLATEARGVGRTIATEGRAAERVKATALAKEEKAAQEKQAEEQAMKDKIAKGEGGFIQSQIEGIYPKGITSFSEASDINILTDSSDAGDRSQQKSFFTIDDILFMVKNKEFEKAGFTQASIIDRLGIKDGESTNTLEELQQFMFEFLLTPHGQNIANSQKMEYKDAAESRRDMLEMLIEGGFRMDNDQFTGPKQN